MKNILFAANTLCVGGIEKALVNMIKSLNDNYKITLVLEEKSGDFLKSIPKNIEIIEYKKSNKTNVILRKLENFFIQLKFRAKYCNKFDFSASYATYSGACSFVARTASKNSTLFVHNDYLNFFNGNEEEYKKFFTSLKYDNFKNIVFVSENDRKVFLKYFKNNTENTITCNNLIDEEEIVKKSEVKIKEKKEAKTTFVHIGRHDEKQKRISRIINSAKKLNEEGYDFEVIFIGDGNEYEKYLKLSENVKNLKFFGKKENPYPYLKLSDCFILSSDFEGYPVVFLEAMLLNKPIITTDVSDSRIDIEDKYGIVTNKNEEDFYKGLKEFLNNGFKIKDKFSPQKFNNNILEKIKKIIEWGK